MSPVFRRESEYTFKIFSNEEERMHIHVLYGRQEAKFWLEPEVELAKNTGIPEHKLNEIERIVEKYAPDFGDTSPKRLYQPLFLFRLRTPLREMFQIRDFFASPKITFQKVKNSLFMGTLRDCYLTKC